MKKIRGIVYLVASFGFFQNQNALSAESTPLWSELLKAISSDNVGQVKSILKADSSLANATNNFSDPPLVLAAGQTNLQIINVLFDAGAEANKVGWRHVTALHKVLEPMLDYWSHRIPVHQPTDVVDAKLTNDRAVRLGIARVLLEHGASIFSVSEYRGNLVTEAARTRDGDLVDFLLLNQHGNARDADGNSVVHIAALWARTNALVELAKGKVDLEITNFAGLTPLQMVSRLPKMTSRPPNYDKNSFLFFDRWPPGLDTDGPYFRELTANLLISLGARRDIYSATALDRTNVAAELLTKDPELPHLQNAAGEIPLHWAAEFGETNIALLLLQAGSPIETTNHQGQTPLDVAAAKGRNSMAELLVAHGALVNRLNGIKAPLHWAAEQGNTPLLQFLLDAGADPNAEDEHNHTALDLAAGANHEPEVKLLLARHARFATGTNNVTTPLHSAVANGNTNLIVLLLRHGANINARNEAGESPFLMAVERENFPVMELLLAHGADINAADFNGNTALHLRAASRSDLIAPPVDPFKPKTDKNPPARNMMEFLLEHGADANATNLAGETPLHCVAGKTFSTNDSIREVQAWIHPLLNHHANLDTRDTNGCTVFQLAAQNYNSPLVEVLLKLGADINARDKSGATALHLVLKKKVPFFDNDKQLAFLEWLLKHGAGVSIADKSGATPLHLVLSEDLFYMDNKLKEQTVALLLKYGAKVNAVDSKGRTPLHLACNHEGEPSIDFLWGEHTYLPGDSKEFEVFWGGRNKGGEELIPAMLLTNGARVNVRDGEGNTPLHYAAEAVRGYTINLLLEHHADRKIKDKDGETPLDLAYQQAGGFEVVHLLQPANVSGEFGDAVWRNDREMVKAFLKDDPRVVNASWLWAYPLHWACNEGNLGMVKLLLTHGAEVNPQHHDSNQAHMVEYNRIENYYYAQMTNCPRNDPEWAIRQEALYESSKSKTNESNFNYGRSSRLSPLFKLSPLQLALANHHYEIARLLVKHGARIDLASAASMGMNGIIQRAIKAEPRRINEYSVRAAWVFQPDHEYGYKFSDERNLQSGSLLHFAVLGNQPKTVKYLLAAGADISMLDDEGRTPCQLAIELKLSEIVTLFK